VPKEWADRYAGQFDDGWDAYRERVFARQKELGVMPPDAELSRHDPDVPDWESLPAGARRLAARMMEVFAGFLSHADHHIGRLLDYLKETGELGNTLVMVVSDNGASPEGGPTGTTNELQFFNNAPGTLEESSPMRRAAWGRRNEYRVRSCPAVGGPSRRRGLGSGGVATVTDATPWARAVRASHDRLAGLVAGLDGAGLRAQSYDTGWSVADVLSHLGSGAEIFSRYIDAGVAGGDPPGTEDFKPVWEAWNARSPEEQAERSVAANEALVSRVESLTPQQRAAFQVTMFGRVPADLAGVLGMRLSEHALHTWDIAVALDPAARVAPDAVELLVDRLPVMVGFMGKKASVPVAVAVATTGPERAFTLDTAGVSLGPVGVHDAPTASLALPAEAFLRLVYGRLDDESGVRASGVALSELKLVFPGF